MNKKTQITRARTEGGRVNKARFTWFGHVHREDSGSTGQQMLNMEEEDLSKS